MSPVKSNLAMGNISVADSDPKTELWTALVFMRLSKRPSLN
jgi:hypothetical protein